MMELAKHIEILLLDNDCVIVPGFGGFMAHPVSAVYDEEEGIFYPPTRTLGFNPQLKINDSLLAQSYVEAYDISYPEALRRIEDDVREVQQCLSTTGRYEMPDVGVLIAVGEESYDFEPCTSGLLTPDLYAFSSFEMPMLSGFHQNVQKPLADSAAYVNTTETADFVASEPAVDVVTDDSDEVQPHEETKANVISINVDSLKKAFATAAVVLFLILFSVPMGDNQQPGIQKCAVDSDMLFRLMPHMEENGVMPKFMLQVPVNDNVTAVVGEEKSNETLPETSSKKITKASEEVTAETSGNYVIVLLSAVPKANAEAYARKLNKEGITDARVYVRNGAVKVVCGSYADMATARKEYSELRSKYPSAAGGWYYRIK